MITHGLIRGTITAPMLFDPLDDELFQKRMEALEDCPKEITLEVLRYTFSPGIKVYEVLRRFRARMHIDGIKQDGDEATGTISVKAE